MTRSRYNPLRQPVSDLAIGEYGWMQIANFVITGFLFLAFAIGLRQKLLPLGAIWGPLIIGFFALGLIGAGETTRHEEPQAAQPSLEPGAAATAGHADPGRYNGFPARSDFYPLKPAGRARRHCDRPHRGDTLHHAQRDRRR
jgi:hypothetical protein